MAEGPGLLGYCTNVHAGESLEATRANLARHATAVRALHAPGERLGVGLWLSAAAAAEVDRPGGPQELAQWLDERGLFAFTFNGFPYGDFHRDVVKHDVYRPDWRDAARLDYTLRLARILAAMLPPGAEGGISTLPLGWGPWLAGEADVIAAAENVAGAATGLAGLHERTGRLVHLDLEPEPGCALERSGDVVAFFDRFVPQASRRYVRVCHDVCHAAVMFEDQDEVLGRYDAAGIPIGKVQISSAVRAPFAELDAAAAAGARRRLAAFDERRYLHQTVVRDDAGERFFEDLGAALAAPGGAEPRGEWRVHFHVPVDVERFGELRTTRDAIERCLGRLGGRPSPPAFEVETYAWDVLPRALRTATLAEGIARELDWCRSRLAPAEASG